MSRFALALLLTAACGGATQSSVDASVLDGSVDPTDATDATDGPGPDTSSTKCPDFLKNRPGQPCTMPEDIECLGDLGASAGWIRCCKGIWSGPNDGGAGLVAPPCP